MPIKMQGHGLPFENLQSIKLELDYQGWCSILNVYQTRLKSGSLLTNLLYASDLNRKALHLVYWEFARILQGVSSSQGFLGKRISAESEIRAY